MTGDASAHTLSIVVPCFNEERTLSACIAKVLAIADERLRLEVIIVDDCSRDRSFEIACQLRAAHPEIVVLQHDRNQGKGAALRTGFQRATGDFVAVQDADLEYRPSELKRLIQPLIDNEADVVFGSRYLSSGTNRVLYFWHTLGNRVLTMLSNMFTDLNLTDMETCYKVFKREVIQGIELCENRFGFEPEVVAKVAHQRLRIVEAGISYLGRTYEEGKKIGWKDGLRALYCILRYNAHRAPWPMQFVLYLFVGGISALVNIVLFLLADGAGVSTTVSAPASYLAAAIVNYFLCITILFRKNARWQTPLELAVLTLVVLVGGALDLLVTQLLLGLQFWPVVAKSMACAVVLVFNFVGRRLWVFPEPASGPWQPQNPNF